MKVDWVSWMPLEGFSSRRRDGNLFTVLLGEGGFKSSMTGSCGVTPRDKSWLVGKKQVQPGKHTNDLSLFSLAAETSNHHRTSISAYDVEQADRADRPVLQFVSLRYYVGMTI